MSIILASYEIKGSDHCHSNSTGINRDLFASKSLFEIPKSKLENTVQKYRAYARSLARDGLISLMCLDNIRETIPANMDPHRFGLYTAFINGSLTYNLLDRLEELDENQKFMFAKKQWPPKQIFKQNAALRATHLAMTLDINGPQACFVDPFSGLIDALNAAEIDLYLKNIDFAIVTGAFSFEDIQSLYFYSQNVHTLFESGICLLLQSDEFLTQWKASTEPSYNEGICSPILQRKIEPSRIKDE